MSFLVRRRTDGTRTQMSFPFAWVYYWLMWPTIGVTAAAASGAGPTWTLCALALWAAWIVQALVMFPALRELKQQMRSGGLKAWGSKYSPTNPLTYEWTAADRSAPQQ